MISHFVQQGFDEPHHTKKVSVLQRNPNRADKYVFKRLL